MKFVTLDAVYYLTNSSTIKNERKQETLQRRESITRSDLLCICYSYVSICFDSKML